MQDKKRYIIGASLLHFLVDGLSVSLYPLLPLIADDFRLSLSKVGTLRTAYSFSTSFAQLPFSMLLENYREIMVLILGMVWIAGGFIFMGLSNSFKMLLIIAVLAGLGGNIQHPIGTSFISKIYDNEGRAGALGILNFSGDVGKTLFPVLVGLLLFYFSWKWNFILIGMMGILIGAVLFIIYASPVKAFKDSDRDKNSIGKSNKKSGTGNRWGILSIPGFVLLSLIGVIDAMSRMVMLTYLPFLLIKKGVDNTKTGFYLTVLLFGGSAGKLGCGFLSDKLGYILMIFTTEILTSITIIMIYLNNSIFLLIPILLVHGFMLNGTSTVLYATVAELVSAEGRNRGYGLFYTIYLVAESLGPMIFGYIGDKISLGAIFYILAALTLVIIPLVLLMQKIHGSLPDGK